VDGKEVEFQYKQGDDTSYQHCNRQELADTYEPYVLMSAKNPAKD
jgi:hypothetical protein